MKRLDWEQMAEEHQEYRVFLEFADEHYEQFQKWLKKKMLQITGHTVG